LKHSTGEDQVPFLLFKKGPKLPALSQSTPKILDPFFSALRKNRLALAAILVTGFTLVGMPRTYKNPGARKLICLKKMQSEAGAH
ncbi:hypothetical protein, partial [Lacticaseibacillus yichunensis]|uniref:hypothetical protein n=1 Tax=Lacticaseibacillus yichunensis TaxID=2486015 RepID=UPI001CDB4890